MEAEPFFEKMLNRIKNNCNGNRCSIKLTKFLGKYYFQQLTEDEYKLWKKTNTAIIPDIRTD